MAEVVCYSYIFGLLHELKNQSHMYGPLTPLTILADWWFGTACEMCNFTKSMEHKHLLYAAQPALHDFL